MNKIKRDLFLDFDGVITDTIGSIVSLYNEDFKYYKNYHYVYPHEINSWNFMELNCATPEYINTYFNQQRFYDNLHFMENAKEVLDRLNNTYNIIIVSLGFSPNLKGKALYIQKNLPYAEFIGVNFKEHSDKANIDMSNGTAFADDSVKNLDTCNCPNPILFGDDYEWNIGNNGKYKRCYNWYEFEKHLNKIT